MEISGRAGANTDRGTVVVFLVWGIREIVWIAKLINNSVSIETSSQKSSLFRKLILKKQFYYLSYRMKCVSIRHLTRILSASEPFLSCTNQPWHAQPHWDKLINGVWLLPATRTPCASDNILCIHYTSFQITLFLQMRNAEACSELWRAGDEDKKYNPGEEKQGIKGRYLTKEYKSRSQS